MTGRIRCVVYIESTVIASSASIWNNIIFFLPCVRGRGKDKGSFVCGGRTGVLSVWGGRIMMAGSCTVC